jgi:hypothetical protein
MNEPIRFRDTYLYKLSEFDSMGILITNVPDTRQITFIFHYKYQEIINGVIMPNSFNFNYHKKEYPEITSHVLKFTGEGISEPIIIDYHDALYNAIKRGQSYICARRDNYVEFENLDTYHPSY